MNQESGPLVVHTHAHPTKADTVAGGSISDGTRGDGTRHWRCVKRDMSWRRIGLAASPEKGRKDRTDRTCNSTDGDHFSPTVSTERVNDLESVAWDGCFFVERSRTGKE